MISEHVLRMHRYLQPGVEEGTPAVDELEQNLFVGGNDAADEASTLAARQETPVWEKYNPLLHGGVTLSGSSRRTRSSTNKTDKQVLAIPFIKKYIQYAKNRCKPELQPEAAEYIVSVYTGLRNDDLASNQKRVGAGVFQWTARFWIPKRLTIPFQQCLSLHSRPRPSRLVLWKP